MNIFHFNLNIYYYHLIYYFKKKKNNIIKKKINKKNSKKYIKLQYKFNQIIKKNIKCQEESKRQQ